MLELSFKYLSRLKSCGGSGSDLKSATRCNTFEFQVAKSIPDPQLIPGDKFISEQKTKSHRINMHRREIQYS